MSGIELQINPVGIAGDYLRCLNRAFGSWGDEANFAWAFEREAGSFPSDLMTMRLDGELVAGSAVSYRKARLRSGAEVDVGIMTGSWTLPAARGQGCFTRSIEASVEVTRDRGGALLLAFVTESNASSRRLAAAGSGLFPIDYVFSTDDTPAAGQPPLEVTPAADVDAALSWIAGTLAGHRRGAFHLHYPTKDSLREQILGRPNPVEVLELREGGELRAACAIERVGGSDRVQLLGLGDASAEGGQRVRRTLLARSQARGQQLFWVTASAEDRARATELGLGGVGGYLTALVADAGALQRALAVGPAWAGETSVSLADPLSPWYLGPFSIESGERM